MTSGAQWAITALSAWKRRSGSVAEGVWKQGTGGSIVPRLGDCGKGILGIQRRARPCRRATNGGVDEQPTEQGLGGACGCRPRGRQPGGRRPGNNRRGHRRRTRTSRCSATTSPTRRSRSMRMHGMQHGAAGRPPARARARTSRCSARWTSTTSAPGRRRRRDRLRQLRVSLRAGSGGLHGRRLRGHRHQGSAESQAGGLHRLDGRVVPG